MTLTKNKPVEIIINQKKPSLVDKVKSSLEKELEKRGYSMRVGNGNIASILQPVAPTRFLYFFEREEAPYYLADIKSVEENSCTIKVYGEENLSKIREIMQPVAAESGIKQIILNLESKLSKRLYRASLDCDYGGGEYLA